MTKCLIGLGANLGDRAAVLRSAWERVLQVPGVRTGRLSRLHATAPVGGPADQPDFLNAAGVVETSLPPEALLRELQRIERELGRERHERWGARTIDLDLLLYGQIEMRTPELVLPHPRMAFRRFVLAPAAEIAGDMIYPINGWTVAKLLEHLDTAPNQLALAASPDFDLEKALADIAARQDVCIFQGRASADPEVELNALAADEQRWIVLDYWPKESAMPQRVKLVVVIDPSAPANSFEAHQSAFRKKLMHQPDSEPVLWLATDSPTLVADEVVAALDAMR